MDLTTINDRLLFASPEKQTDVAVVFGAKSTSGEVARHTADLYHAGAFSKIILTGGCSVFQPLVLGALSLQFSGLKSPRLDFTNLSDFLSGEKEADYMETVLLEKGVPQSAIAFKEAVSKNTGQNVTNIMSQLRTESSAAIITTAYSQRRAIGTIRFHPEYDELNLVPYPVYPFGFTRENWHQTPIKGLVELEAERINPESTKTYVGRFCIDPDIKDEIERSSYLPDLQV